MASNSEDDYLNKVFKNLEIDTDNLSQEDYYVHIDVLDERGSNKPASRINSFMIRNDAYDPRRATNFPTDLMDANDREKREAHGPNLGFRRYLAGGLSAYYYEFWKVRSNLPFENFNTEVVQQLPNGVEIRVVRIIDNDHEITNYTSDSKI